MKFSNLNLGEELLKALRDEQYTNPTSIQEKAIPLILEGRDVLGSAQTGTGKTGAFGIPIIQNLLNSQHNKSGRRKISTLIVTPTRELAIQIGENLTSYSKYTNLKNTVIFGGVPQGSQVKAL